MVAVGVIGSGAWGTTLAYLLAKKGFETTLWDHHPERAIDMQQKRENADFLPGIRFPAMLHVTPHIAEAVEGKEMLLFVTPSQRMRENIKLLAPFVGNETLLVNASKGIEIGSLKRMTEVISEEIPGTHNRVAALSGPNIAQEVAEGKPTAAVVAAHKEEIATRVRTLLTTARFRVYTASDLVGVQLGGALKNIIAIGAGFMTLSLPVPARSAVISNWDSVWPPAKNWMAFSRRCTALRKASPPPGPLSNWQRATTWRCPLPNNSASCSSRDWIPKRRYRN